MSKPPLTLLIAAPRGFCAGVDRAIRIVELALERYGAPVYVRHEIVHNKFVVDGLKAKGAIFVPELDAVPDGAPVVFSAHGVPKSVPARAQARGLNYLDATCPLVSKVHRQAERLTGHGRHILFVGHAGHPEVIGTFGQVPEGRMTLIETAGDAESVAPEDPDALAFLTQTTLSVDDTAEIVAILKRRFPSIQGPRSEDICYATSNRQAAVKAIAARCDAMLVIGSPNSSNSQRLVEVAEREGTPGRLIGRGADIDFAWLEGVRTLGVTAGASAPELLVREVVDALRRRFDVDEEPVEGVEERMVFKLPAGSRGRVTAEPAPELTDVEVFTDGACKGNPGPGGWGAVVRAGAREKEMSGGEPLTTNNRMELMAAIRALRALTRPCRVQLYTDSNYVRDGITKWIHGWRKNGWRTADRKPVKNADLWQELVEAAAPHRVEWHWVRGHSGHKENERADALASAAAEGQAKRAAE